MTRDDGKKVGSLAALTRQLPREIPPPPELWAAIAARLEPRDRLDRLAASLPTQVDPPKDLWHEIEARIAPARRQRRAALALAASILVAAAVAVGVRLGDRHGSGAEGDTGSFVFDGTASDSVDVSGNVAWVLGDTAVAGDVAASLSDELALVRDERLSIERAIAKQPDNVDLRELWAFTYKAELELADAAGRTAMEFQRERG